MNKTTNSGVCYYPPKSEKNKRIVSKSLDSDLLIRLVQELDSCIDKAVEYYFRDILEKIKILVEHPCEDQIPSLVLSGHCIDWPNFIHLINRLIPNICIIKQKACSFNISKVLDEITEEKAIFFLEHDGSDYLFLKEFIKEIKHSRVQVFLVFHTPISFSTVYDRIPRKLAIHLHISNASFQPFGAFLRILFEQTLPLCFLHSNGILIKSPTYLYEMDNRSLNSVRRSLILALYCYSTTNKKLPAKQELISIQSQIKVYSVLLNWFSTLLSFDGGKTSLHFKLQNNSEFFKILLEKIKSSSKVWSKDNWITKLQSLLPVLHHLGKELEREHINCKQLINKLENYNKMNVEELENNSPDILIDQSIKNSNNSRLLRSRFSIKKPQLNTTAFLIQRDKEFKRLCNPLPELLYSELLNYLNTLFLDRCAQQKWKFIAEYSFTGFGDNIVTFLNPALSTEIDYQLGENAKKEDLEIGQEQQQQLDICLVYSILIQYGIDQSAIQLSKLYDTFYQFAPKIDGIEFNARFMAAIAQLEYIGAVKQVNEGIVRLIYLPVATFAQDIFKSN